MKEEKEPGQISFFNVEKDEIDEPKLFEIPDCAICLLELSQKQEASECGHVFHAQCIQKHLKNRSQCPICNLKIKKNFKLFYQLTQNKTYVLNLKQKLKNDQQKISQLQEAEINLQKSFKDLNQEIDQKNKLLESKQEKNKDLYDFIQKERQETFKQRQQFRQRVRKLQHENYHLKREFQILKNKSKRLLQLQKLVQNPDEVITQMKEIFFETDYFEQKIINECSQLLKFQSKEITKQKKLNLKLKEQLKNQEQRIKQLEQNANEIKINQEVMKKQCEKLQISNKKLKKDCQFFRSRYELAFGQDQYYDLEDFLAEQKVVTEKNEKKSTQNSLIKTFQSMNPQYSLLEFLQKFYPKDIKSYKQKCK